MEVESLSNFITLKNIDIKIRKGDFVCVIGEVGAGKSSLLGAILGDLIHIDSSTLEEFESKELSSDKNEWKETIEKFMNSIKNEKHKSHWNPPIEISGSVSLIEQIPWIQSMTIRNNILYGNEMNEEMYNHCIHICCLANDLEILEGGDLTEIGEKGINLSGG